MRTLRPLVAAVLMLAGALLPGAAPRRLAIAAAADLQYALGELKTVYLKAHPDLDIALTFAASGALYAQLTNKAPFDLFLSADLDYPRRLAAAGLADPSTEFRYSRGHLVLWAPKASPIPVERLGLQAIHHPAARRIALANPRHAPYGRAAEAALAKLGVLESVRPRLVFGENIAQTAQFAETGTADLALLALSLTKAPALAGGRSWELPLEAYPPLDQGGIIPNHAPNRAEALAFRTFLGSPEAVAILKRFGFSIEGR